MQACSKEFTQVLGEVRSTQSAEARKARTDSARTAYDEAQLRCMDAAAKLQEHVIRESVSLEFPLKQAATPEYGRRSARGA